MKGIASATVLCKSIHPVEKKPTLSNATQAYCLLKLFCLIFLSLTHKCIMAVNNISLPIMAIGPSAVLRAQDSGEM